MTTTTFMVLIQNRAGTTTFDRWPVKMPTALHATDVTAMALARSVVRQRRHNIDGNDWRVCVRTDGDTPSTHSACAYPEPIVDEPTELSRLAGIIHGMVEDNGPGFSILNGALVGKLNEYRHDGQDGLQFAVTLPPVGHASPVFRVRIDQLSPRT